MKKASRRRSVKKAAQVLHEMREATIERAKRILMEGLRYHEHDGHFMPKRVAREALEALGVPRGDQP